MDGQWLATFSIAVRSSSAIYKNLARSGYVTSVRPRQVMCSTSLALLALKSSLQFEWKLDRTTMAMEFWSVLNRISDVLGVLTALPMLAAAILFLAPGSAVSSAAAGDGRANKSPARGVGSLSYGLGYQRAGTCLPRRPGHAMASARVLPRRGSESAYSASDNAAPGAPQA